MTYTWKSIAVDSNDCRPGLELLRNCPTGVRGRYATPNFALVRCWRRYAVHSAVSPSAVPGGTVSQDSAVACCSGGRFGGGQIVVHLRVLPRATVPQRGRVRRSSPSAGCRIARHRRRPRDHPRTRRDPRVAVRLSPRRRPRVPSRGFPAPVVTNIYITVKYNYLHHGGVWYESLLLRRPGVATRIVSSGTLHSQVSATPAATVCGLGPLLL